jgi:hypothetical protein
MIQEWELLIEMLDAVLVAVMLLSARAILVILILIKLYIIQDTSRMFSKCSDAFVATVVVLGLRQRREKLSHSLEELQQDSEKLWKLVRLKKLVKSLLVVVEDLSHIMLNKDCGLFRQMEMLEVKATQKLISEQKMLGKFLKRFLRRMLNF